MKFVLLALLALLPATISLMADPPPPQCNPCPDERGGKGGPRPPHRP